MPKIELVNIRKTFDDVVAAREVNLVVEDREYVSLIGPSGCGKTTLLRIIAGTINPDIGEVRIDGKVVNDLPPEDREIAYVFQDLLLFPHMNLIENVSYSPLVKNLKLEERSRIVGTALRLMNLQVRGESFPSELSRGMQQKIALARALASASPLLLLDEPLSTLDPRARYELRLELRDLVKDAGLTAIHVTHDQDEAMSVADRVFIMRNGTIVATGSPLELYEEPASPFVARFVGGECNFLEGRVALIGAREMRVEVEGKVWTAAPAKLEVDERAVVAIRPEHVEISTGSGDGLAAEITGSEHLGIFVRYELRLESGKEVISKARALGRPYMRGQRVFISAKPDNVHVYPYPREGLMEAISIE